MRESGFLQNRLFDALACAAPVITDRVVGLREVFGDTVRCYDDVDELRLLCASEADVSFGDEESRCRMADRVRRDHSFDARALTLLHVALEGRGAGS